MEQDAATPRPWTCEKKGERRPPVVRFQEEKAASASSRKDGERPHRRGAETRTPSIRKKGFKLLVQDNEEKKSVASQREKRGLGEQSESGKQQKGGGASAEAALIDPMAGQVRLVGGRKKKEAAIIRLEFGERGHPPKQSTLTQDWEPQQSNLLKQSSKRIERLGAMREKREAALVGEKASRLRSSLSKKKDDRETRSGV